MNQLDDNTAIVHDFIIRKPPNKGCIEFSTLKVSSETLRVAVDCELRLEMATLFMIQNRLRRDIRSQGAAMLI